MPTLPRECRLVHNKQFAAISSQGSSWATSLMVLKALPNGLEYSRYGFSVSRHLGNAVKRNHIRRLLRESVRLSSVKQGWDLLFIARKALADAEYRQVKQAIEQLLVRSRLKSEPMRQSEMAKS